MTALDDYQIDLSLADVRSQSIFLATRTGDARRCRWTRAAPRASCSATTSPRASAPTCGSGTSRRSRCDDLRRESLGALGAPARAHRRGRRRARRHRQHDRAVLRAAGPDEQAGRERAGPVGEPVQRRPRGPGAAAGRHPARRRHRPAGDRRAPGCRGPPDRGVDRLLRRGRPAGPRAARRAGAAGGLPLGPARRDPRPRRRAAPGGHGAGRAVRGADQRPAQRAGEDLLRDHQVVADGEPARAVRPRRPGDAGARARDRRDHRGPAPQPRDVARAFAALKGEVDERRVAEEALARAGSARWSSGRRTSRS